MIEPTSSLFWQAALRSGLISPPRLRECWGAISPDGRDADQVDRLLARQAVSAGYLTAWQARQMLRGRPTLLVIDKYQLLDLIGRGGMGRVYLAWDGRLNRRVALKVLSKGRPDDARAVQRFRREVRLGAQLQHENLVRIYDEGEVLGQFYLVMEYIDGPSVARLLDEHGPMPASTAARLGRQVALGLEHARQKGMIHRDVNPGNILVTREGTAKLADLGLAIEVGDGQAMTQDGSFLGNYDYISPEQARNSRGADTRSDIYSLGCTLYHMIAGQIPFPFPSLPEKIQAHLAADPAPLGTLAPGLPAGLEGVVARMMRKAPEDRYPDPPAVAKALEPFLDDRGDSSAAISLPNGLGRAGFPFGSRPSSADGEGNRLPSSSAQGPVPPTSSSVSGPPSPSSPDGIENSKTLEWPGPISEVIARSSGLASAYLASLRATSARGRLAILLALALALSAGVAAVIAIRRGPGEDPGAGRVERASELRVVVVAPDGEETRHRDLKEALRAGAGGDLRIVLRGGGTGPFLLRSSEALEVLSGSVTIGADPASRPELELALSGTDPFLRVGPRATLKLQGLAIRAAYAGREREVPPLIESGGTLILDRCAFWTNDRAAMSGAVSSDGARFVATGCWFGGFRRCLDVGAFDGAEALLEQCMVIGNPDGDPASGWAIRVRHEPSSGGERRRKLTLRRCTVSDACLLRADDFNPSAPLSVSAEANAVQSGASLAWKSDSRPTRESLLWSGRDNVYDLSRAAWVVPLNGPPPGPEGLIDADAWSRMTDDRASRARAIPFARPALERPASPDPEGYRVRADRVAPVGADPLLVGPGKREDLPQDQSSSR